MDYRKFALLIGCSTYDDPSFTPLTKAEADVLALAKVLRDPYIGNFANVKELINEPVNVIKQEIARFFLRGRSSEDLLLLYFSGHGDPWNKTETLYLLGKDTESELFVATAISSSFIKEAMAESPSKRQVLILDCCYSGAFLGMKGTSQLSTEAVTAFAGNGSVILTASSAAERAWEGNKPLSLFTHYLVLGLKTGEADRNKDGQITLDEWYDYAFDGVKDDPSARQKQTPSKSILRQQGSLIIAKNRAMIRQTSGLENKSSETASFVSDTFSNNQGLKTSSYDDVTKLRSEEHVANMQRYALTSFSTLHEIKGSVSPLTFFGYSVVQSCLISPDEQFLVSYNKDRTISVWDFRSRKLLYNIEEHLKAWIRSHYNCGMAISADGQTLVTAWTDKTIKIWDLRTGTLTRTIKGHPDSARRGFTISANGQILASSDDKITRIWDLHSGTLLHTLKHSALVLCSAVSSNGRTFASIENNGFGVKSWDLYSGKLLPPVMDPISYPCLALSPDGQILAIGHYSRQDNDELDQIYLWNPFAGKLIHILEAPTLFQTRLCFDYDGQILIGTDFFFYSGGTQMKIYIWDVRTGTLLNTLEEENEAVGVDFSNGHIFIFEVNGKTITVWEGK